MAIPDLVWFGQVWFGLVKIDLVSSKFIWFSFNHQKQYVLTP